MEYFSSGSLEGGGGDLLGLGGLGGEQNVELEGGEVVAVAADSVEIGGVEGGGEPVVAAAGDAVAIVGGRLGPVDAEDVEDGFAGDGVVAVEPGGAVVGGVDAEGGEADVVEEPAGEVGALGEGALGRSRAG